MSRLEELVQELCPDGVEYKRLENCCHLQKGTTPIQKAIPGEYPLVVTTDERKSSNKYQFDAPTVCIPLVSSRGHGVACLNQVYYQEGKFALGNILCGVTPKDNNELSANFLYHYLNYKKDTLIVPLMKGGANVSLTVDSLKRVKVPVPPLKVQVEVIRILDKFIALSAELKAELTARKKQYEYYRDIILRSKAAMVTKKLGEICDFVRGPFGGSLKKETFTQQGYAVYEQQHAIYGEFRFRYYIDEKKFNEMKRFQVNPGDLIMSCSGTMGKVSIIPENAPKGVINQALLKLTPKSGVSNKFLKYCFENSVTKQMNSTARGGAIQNVASVNVLKDIEIQVPSLPEQQRIVAILDRFDTICNDLTSGLPAEIEARQGQYEYYRDKLLTFKERTDELL